MLMVQEWSVESKELDFSSSGLSNPIVRAIHVDGELLCNAYELTAWEAENDRMQLIICDNCGVVHCESGGWVTFRRAENSMFIVPLLQDILSGDDWRQSEYSPPSIIRKRGVVVFGTDVYSEFLEAFPEFPAPESIKPMTYGEALRVFQIEAPGRVLGDPFGCRNNSSRLDLALAASEGDTKELSRRVARLFEVGLSREDTAIIRPPPPGEIPVSLYLDLADIPEWNVLWRGKTDGLYLSPMHKLEIIEDSEPARAG